ncbi:hypothetical protein [Nocardioides ungokensis]|uniref:hypothetical protein n=1 Tax=Nocardioides ungokensis TaxID=1643322 RepID=UPI0015DE9C17|nr:hypothetical protein [Nocardioides ungokensis]
MPVGGAAVDGGDRERRYAATHRRSQEAVQPEPRPHQRGVVLAEPVEGDDERQGAPPGPAGRPEQ